MDAAALLQNNGVRPSVQRVRILGNLLGRHDHPVADAIWSDLAPDMPTLSRTTVYNTLHLLAARGLIRPVGIEDGELRYDADIREHAHFKCVECGAVTDLHDPEGMRLLNRIAPNELYGCEIRSRHLYYRGVCRDCRSDGPGRLHIKGDNNEQ